MRTSTERPELSSGLPRKLLFGGAAAGIAGFARFAALFLLARELGPTAFGEFVWFLWVAELAAVIVTAGWSQAVTRYVAEYRAGGRQEEAEAMASHLIRRGVLWGMTGLPVFAGVLFWAPATGAATFFLAGGLYLAGVVGAFAPAWLQGNQWFGRHAGLSVAMGFLVVAGGWAGVRYAGVAGGLAGFLVAAVPAVAIVVAVGSRRSRGEPAEEELRRVKRFVAATWGASAVSAIVWMRTEIVFLERLAGAEAAGLYASALVFATALTQVVLLFRGIFLPHFSGLIGRKEPAGEGRLKSAYERSTLLFAVVLFPVCFFGAAVAPVVARAFGEGFAGAWPLFAVLAAGGAVHLFAAGGALASSLERNRFVFGCACAGAVGFALLCIGLIPVWGIWGAATARLCGQWGMGIAGAIYLSRRAGVRLPIGALVWTAGAAAAGAGICGWRVGAGESWLDVAVGLAAGSILYVTLMLLQPVVRESLRR